MRKLITRVLLITLTAAGAPVAIAVMRGDPAGGVLGGFAFALLVITAVVLLGRLAVLAAERAGWHRLARALGREIGQRDPSDT